MTNEQVLLLKIANIENAFSKQKFSKSEAKRFLGVGDKKLASLINEGKLKVLVNGKSLNSAWRCDGRDVFRLLFDGESKVKVKL